jgi:hypothetical protein
MKILTYQLRNTALLWIKLDLPHLFLIEQLNGIDGLLQETDHAIQS